MHPSICDETMTVARTRGLGQRSHLEVYATCKKPTEIRSLSLWENPHIVAEVFTSRAVLCGALCHDITHARGPR